MDSFRLLVASTRTSPLEVRVSLLYWVLGQDDTYELVFEMPVPEDLTGTDWQQLVSPPTVPTTAENGFWHGAANEGQYFLIRWIVQEGTTGVFSITPRDGMVRGPIS